MKHKFLSILSALAIVAGLILSAVAPWWAVWFVCFPCIFAGVVYLLSTKTDYLKNY